MARGILYVMTTVVPGLVKIGKTGLDNFESKMRNLERNGYANVTGLQRYFAIKVEDYDEKEVLLDTIFSTSNVIGTKLFAVDVNIVTQLLSSFEGEVVYPMTESKEKVFDNATTEVEKALEDVVYSKAKRFRFSMVGITEGETLTYTKDTSIQVKVVDDTRVEYQGKKYYLSGLAKKLHGTSTEVRGPQYFMYNGKRLTDLRDEKEME